jgi:hypothetical protein
MIIGVKMMTALPYRQMLRCRMVDGMSQFPGDRRDATIAGESEGVCREWELVCDRFEGAN